MNAWRGGSWPLELKSERYLAILAPIYMQQIVLLFRASLAF